jgi:hypothetical protein
VTYEVIDPQQTTFFGLPGKIVVFKVTSIFQGHRVLPLPYY